MIHAPRPHPARPRLDGAAIATALLFTACAGQEQARPSAPSQKALPELTDREIQELVADVSALRGIPVQAAIPIERLDERRFADAIEWMSRNTASGADGAQAALSFSAENSPGASSPRAVLHEQVIGFYHEGTGKVYLRSGYVPRDDDNPAELRRLVLAHEVQHALQNQRFGGSRLQMLLDEDTRLARLAVREGDASLVGTAYIGWTRGVPISRIASRLAREAARESTESFLGSHAHSRVLAGAPPMDRERLLFPYRAGSSFIAEIYRAGGFPLVDRVFEHPPSTTEQVLHPEKYVAGEQAVPVRAPAAPAGSRPIAAGRMGELQIRALLVDCVGPAQAVDAASGWGGDAFLMVSGPDSSRGFLWSTVWDSEADAWAFEQAMRASPRCWPGARTASHGTPVLSGASIVRQGTNVAFTNGLRGDPQAVMPALIALPESPLAPAPPLGPVTLRPPSVLPPKWPAVIRGWEFLHPWLGLAGVIPPGMTARTPSKDIELVVKREGTVESGIVVLSDLITTPAFNLQVMDALARGFASAAGVQPVMTWDAEVTLPVGPAVVRRWVLPGTPVELQAFLVPICNGTGSYVFVQTWSNGAEKAELDQWVTSFRRVSDARAPVCTELTGE
jgi:hypothetical protein